MKTSLWYVMCVSAVVFCGVVFSDKIISAHTGGTFGRSIREPKFKIEFHSEESPFYPDQDSVVMPNKYGEKFLCYLPKVEKSKKGKLVAQQNISSTIVESEIRVKLKTPDELLEVLKGGCFVRQEGWWSYELCHLRQLRQIHLEDEKVVQEFILGVYDKEATDAHNQNLSDVSTLKDPRVKDASQRYHAHIFTNGTSCDLTNEPRETEVRFVCSEPRAMISSITELSTCKYALTFQCPSLCKHPLFNEEMPVSHSIHCNALPNEEPKAEAATFQSGKISMVTDGIFCSCFQFRRICNLNRTCRFFQGGKITIVTDTGCSPPAFSSEEYATLMEYVDYFWTTFFEESVSRYHRNHM